MRIAEADLLQWTWYLLILLLCSFEHKISQNRSQFYLLSWDDLMPTSFGRPLKYEMSRAAKELQVTRLLRAPQMLTTTSLDGVFWRPSLGSFATRTFTMLVAAKTKKKGGCLKGKFVEQHSEVQLCSSLKEAGPSSHPTHVVFVGRVSCQISQQAGQRPQLHVIVGV